MIHPRHMQASTQDWQYLEAYTARVSHVSEAFGISRESLLSYSRKRAHVWPRQALFWLLHVEDGIPAAAIGRLMGFDHTSILHGVQAHGARLERVAPARVRETSGGRALRVKGKTQAAQDHHSPRQNY
jgi:hypothetical protein